MQHEVYWNRTRKCWSVRERGGKVVGHRKVVFMKDATFIVQPGGRDRVRRTGHKIVHAWVRGELCDLTPSARRDSVVYNPKTMDGFQTQDGRPVSVSPYVIFTATGNVSAVLEE